jgi:hypothetical protein
MDPTRARAILKSLADGRDPTTGATFPPDSPYQQADTVRALHAALEALDGPPEKKRPANPDRPQLGLKWAPEEEQRLRDAFTAKTPIPVIATAHGRSAGAITSRLVKLGLIEDDFAHPAHRPHPPATPPDRQTAPPADRPPPRPPNPKPDDDLPF